MAKLPATTSLAPEIRRTLAALRWRIRFYVLLQGLSVAASWLILTFWVGLGLDYLPVLLGASEMPRVARGLLLALIALVLGYILYRWVLRRLFTQLADRSMAILLERQFDKLGESLITSVEMSNVSDRATPLGRQMLATTQLQALRQVQSLRVSRVLNFRPLFLCLCVAVVMAVTIGTFYVVNAHALGLGVQRIYLLDDRPWPRNTKIEILGIEATRLSVEGESESSIVPFAGRSVKVARGSSASLVVRADSRAEVVPESCTIVYRTAEGDRGRVNMTRVGQIRDGYQIYKYDGKPLRGILSDVQFDVLGFDHRIRDHVIAVVDSPTLIRAELDCVFPQYMVDEATSSRLPRMVPLSTGTRLPRGTNITLRAQSNKPLRQVRITDSESGEGWTVQVAGDLGDGISAEFTHPLGPLQTNVALEVGLIDADNVISENPYRIFVEAVEDLPPLVNIRLEGIGTAVTPDVSISIRGEVTDDYGVDRSWIELLIDDGTTQELSMGLAASVVATDVDFRQLRRTSESIELAPGNKLRLAVKAQDRHDLAGGPHVGISDVYQLEVVTAEQLLEMLETRELALRQRFEQTIKETRETGEVLARIRNEGPVSASEPSTEQPSASAAPPSEPAIHEAATRSWSLRLMRAQRSTLQSQKSAQETLGVAASIRDIRNELINNRVDSEDRQQRLQDQIAAPLEEIGRFDFAELDQRIQELVSTMDQEHKTDPFQLQDNPETVAATRAAMQQNDLVLLKLDEVLQNMMRLEDYNELLNIARSLIAEQERVIGRTKEEQKKQVLELLQ
jgi:hypothetical protein